MVRPAAPGSPAGVRAPGVRGRSVGDPPLADAGKRFAARLLDGLIVGIPTLIIGSLIMSANVVSAMDDTIQLSLVLIIFSGYFYDWLMHAFAGGQTVGKKVVRTRVVRLDGAPLSARAAAARSAILALLPLLPCCGGLFYLINAQSLLWDKPYQQCSTIRRARRWSSIPVERFPADQAAANPDKPSGPPYEVTTLATLGPYVRHDMRP